MIFEIPPSAHPLLLLSFRSLYEPAALRLTSKPIRDDTCKEYAGYDFKLNDKNVKFRAAKITPTKNGQFVTFWKRNAANITAPYDATDSIDVFVVACKDDSHFGQFVFPKAVFLERHILSMNGKGGKRAIRVYPPWVQPESKQAATTQDWQCKYFVSSSGAEGTSNVEKLRRLFGEKSE